MDNSTVVLDSKPACRRAAIYAALFIATDLPQTESVLINTQVTLLPVYLN
jgi:hypothetical protein